MDANISKILDKSGMILQKLTIKQVVYLITGFFVFVGTTMYFQFISPKINKIKQLKREYKDSTTLLHSKKDKLKMVYLVKEKYEVQNTKYESENNNRTNILDNSNEYPIFLADMANCFEDANNDILSLQSLPKRSVNLPEVISSTDFVLEEYPIDIKAKGTYNSIIEFLKILRIMRD